MASLEKFKTLYSGETASRSSNPWCEKALIVLMSEENSPVYNSLSSTKTLTAYKDAGSYAIGFGLHTILAGQTYNIKGNKKYLSTDFSVQADTTIVNMANNTPGAQAKVMAEQYFYKSVCTPLWEIIKKNYPTWVYTMHDHEFFGLAEFCYNMSVGFKVFATGTDFATMRAAITKHQAAKYAYLKSKGTLDGVGSDSAVNAVLSNAASLDGKTFTLAQVFALYSTSDGVYMPGLARRRVKDYNIYGGNASYSYAGDDVPAVDSNVKSAQVSIVIGISRNVNNAAMVAAGNQSVGNENAAGYLTAMYNGDTKLAKQYLATFKDGVFSNPKNNPNEGKFKYEEDKTDESLAFTPTSFSVDARGYGGDLLPDKDYGNVHKERRSTIDKDNANKQEEGDFFKSRFSMNINTSYGSFRKYKQTTNEDVSGTSTTWFFLTRPEMCLYQNSNGNEKDSSENWHHPSYQCMDVDLKDHLILDRDLYIYLDCNIKPYYTDTNLAFIPSFTNNFKSTNLPEARFEMLKSSSNILGVSLGIPVYNSNDTADTEITVQFNADMRKSIMSYIDVIFKYSKSKKEGLTLPWAAIAKHNVIDISMTMFVFVVGQDGLTLESWFRSVGVVPSTNPVTQIPLTSAGERMDTINVTFKCNTNLDSRKLSTIEHFNALNRMGCSKVKEVVLKDGKKATFSGLTGGNIQTYDAAIDWYLLNRNILDIYIDENMDPSDWHVERFLIYADATSGLRTYKFTGVPKAHRLYELIQFVISSKGKDTLFSKMSGRSKLGNDKKNTMRFRPDVLSTYFVMPLDQDEIGKVMHSMDNDAIGSNGNVNLDNGHDAQHALLRTMSNFTTQKIRQTRAVGTRTSNGWNAYLGTGVKLMDNIGETTEAARGSLKWMMDMFKEMDAYKLVEGKQRPNLTRIFVDDEGNESVVAGFESLSTLLTKHTTFETPKQASSFRALFGSFVPYEYWNASASSLSTNNPTAGNAWNDIMGGSFEMFKGISDVKDSEDKNYKFEAINIDGTTDTSKMKSTWAKGYRVSAKAIDSPLKSITPNGVFVIKDDPGLTNMENLDAELVSAFTADSTKEYSMYTDTTAIKTIEGKTYSSINAAKDANVATFTEYFTNNNASRKVDLMKTAMLYGYDIHDSTFLKLLSAADDSSSTDGGSDVSVLNMNGVDMSKLITEYWAMINMIDSEKTGEAYTKAYNEMKKTSPSRSVFYTTYDTKEEWRSNIHKGANSPYIVVDGDTMKVYRLRAKIAYLDDTDSSNVKQYEYTRNTNGDKVISEVSKNMGTINIVTNRLTGLPANEEDSQPSAVASSSYVNYDMDTEGTLLSGGGYEQYSLMNKTVIIPSMSYISMRSFFLCNFTTDGKPTEYIKFTDKRYLNTEKSNGVEMKLYIAAFDGVTNLANSVSDDAVIHYDENGVMALNSSRVESTQTAYVLDSNTTSSRHTNTSSTKTKSRSKNALPEVSLPSENNDTSTDSSVANSYLTDSLWDNVLPDKYDGTSIALSNKLRDGYFGYETSNNEDLMNLITSQQTQSTLAARLTSVGESLVGEAVSNTLTLLVNKYTNEILPKLFKNINYSDGKPITVDSSNVVYKDDNDIIIEEADYSEVTESLLSVDNFIPTIETEVSYVKPENNLKGSTDSSFVKPEVTYIIDVTPKITVEEIKTSDVSEFILEISEPTIVKEKQISVEVDKYKDSTPAESIQKLNDTESSTSSEEKLQTLNTRYEDKSSQEYVLNVASDNNVVSAEEKSLNVVKDTSTTSSEEKVINLTDSKIETSSQEYITAVSSVKPNSKQDISRLKIQNVKSSKSTEETQISNVTQSDVSVNEETKVVFNGYTQKTTQQESILDILTDNSVDYEKYSKTSKMTSRVQTSKDKLDTVVKDIADGVFDFNALINYVVKYDD